MNNTILDQTMLMNRLIGESLDVQSKTKQVLSEINRAELDYGRYASTLDALRTVHFSFSKILEKEQSTFDDNAQNFVSNFILRNKDKEYMNLKRSLSKKTR